MKNQSGFALTELVIVTVMLLLVAMFVMMGITMIEDDARARSSLVGQMQQYNREVATEAERALYGDPDSK